jgi:hypothetical protein
MMGAFLLALIALATVTGAAACGSSGSTTTTGRALPQTSIRLAALRLPRGPSSEPGEAGHRRPRGTARGYRTLAIPRGPSSRTP